MVRPTRCSCGVLASLERACKRCGRNLHLAHGHPPDDDPDHFKNVKHEWYYTGGSHSDGECPYVHRHPEPFTGHDHEGGGS